MKKTHKKIFGLFGLVLVAALTIFAAFLPGPETQASEGKVVTDTVQVRVVGESPDVNMTGIVDRSVFVKRRHDITVTYENVDDLSIVFKYTDGYDIEQTMSLLKGDDGHVNYSPGEITVSFDLLSGEYSYINWKGETVVEHMDYYGFGGYVIDVNGVGRDGSFDSDHTSFLFCPVVGSVDKVVDDEYYDYYLDLDYDEYGSATGGEVTKLEIKVYDAAEREVTFSPLTVTAPNNRIELPFAGYGLEDGTYSIKIYAYGYNESGVYGLLYVKPYEINVDYMNKVPEIPDTGGMLQDLNISKTDYIITGLIIFSIVGISGAVFISKHDKKTRNGRKR